MKLITGDAAFSKGTWKYKGKTALKLQKQAAGFSGRFGPG